MDRDEAFERFSDCAVKVLGITKDQIKPEASFAGDLDADSLDLVELIMALEDEFSITVPESELEGVDTIGKAFDLVYGKLG